MRAFGAPPFTQPLKTVRLSNPHLLKVIRDGLRISPFSLTRSYPAARPLLASDRRLTQKTTQVPPQFPSPSNWDSAPIFEPPLVHFSDRPPSFLESFRVEFWPSSVNLPCVSEVHTFSTPSSRYTPLKSTFSLI